MTDPAPLGVSQVAALVCVAWRELHWVLPGVEREVAAWRELAQAIPSAEIREDALATLDTKRFNTEGAALFATVPRHRDMHLLRVLVAYQLIWDFLDCLSERPCEDVVRNGLQLHLALSEALDPDAPTSDYYRYHPWREDAGFLHALVTTCRDACALLPSYECVRQVTVREAIRGRVLALNHEPEPVLRDVRLQAWVEREFPDPEDLSWYELTGAASSSLAIHALLALAAESRCTQRDVGAAYAAYFPWICLASTMLDSFVDLAEDAANEDHSYLAHYPTTEVAVARLREIVWRSAYLARRLPRGTRHALLATGMVTMYLTKESPRTPDLSAAMRSILKESGRLAMLLWPILRTWRRAYGQRTH